MIFILWLINFGISWFNARQVGSVWDSSKAKGGLAHFMAWMGAVMSASGFTWCYVIVLGLLGTVLPMSLLQEAKEGMPPVEGPILDPVALEALFQLGYIVVIFPILGSGLAITVETWRYFARKQNRSVGDYAITGWNTFAQVHNTWSAVQHIPGVLDNLGKFFGGALGGGGKDSKGKVGIFVIVAVVMACIGGILTTYAIVQARRRAVVYEDRYAEAYR